MCWSLVGTICACRLKKRMGALSVPTCNGVGWVCCAYINVLCVADVVCKCEGRIHTVTSAHPTLLITEDLEKNGWSADRPSSTCVYWSNLLCCWSDQVYMVLHVSVCLRTLCLPSSADMD